MRALGRVWASWTEWIEGLTTLSLDGYALFFCGLFVLIGMLVNLMARDYLEREGKPVADFYALVYLAVFGAFSLILIPTGVVPTGSFVC